MDCPKCGKTMENGHLWGHRREMPIFWLPEEHKNSFFMYTDNAVLKRDGLVFDKDFLEVPRLETCICRNCGVGMFVFGSDN